MAGTIARGDLGIVGRSGKSILDWTGTSGRTVIDLGCGAGADVCIATLLVGHSGWVIGVDVTPAMVEKARANVALVGFSNVEIIEADIANISCPDTCADVVLSNGAIIERYQDGWKREQPG